jgi:pyruvate/2-oxoglutarate dehydrogenase complex dihydrolipoamide acyltransferase (E2) component
MAASHAAVPAVTLNAEADVTELLARREALPAGSGEATGDDGAAGEGQGDGRSRAAGTDPRPAVRPSVNDLVLFAVSRVLPEHPQVNAHLDGEELLLFEEVNLGVAVAVEDGLVVPVITGVAERDLADLAAEGRRLAQAARAGSLKLEELDGATFSVTNLGMFGVTSFNPIINLPQVGILGVGTATPRLAQQGDGEIVERRFMTLSFTFDHRAMDGAGAARFLQDVCSRLEQADGIIPAAGPARAAPAARTDDSPNAKDTT